MHRGTTTTMAIVMHYLKYTVCVWCVCVCVRVCVCVCVYVYVHVYICVNVYVPNRRLATTHFSQFTFDSHFIPSRPQSHMITKVCGMLNCGNRSVFHWSIDYLELLTKATTLFQHSSFTFWVKVGTPIVGHWSIKNAISIVAIEKHGETSYSGHLYVMDT